MFIVREVLHCKPGKTGELVKKFKQLGIAAKAAGYKPFRLMTDVSGERFWTLVAEIESDTIDGMREMEEKVMAREDAQAAMSGYHDLVIAGRREIFKVEG
jgi:hypothetical protein